MMDINDQDIEQREDCLQLECSKARDSSKSWIIFLKGNGL